MSEHLVLRIDPDQSDRASWVIVDGGGQTITMTESGTLAEASRRAQQRSIFVLVPGQEVLVTRIALPVRGRSKMLQAVPFALEEQLADSVGAMHFALGARDENGQIEVAVVQRDRLEGWLGKLNEAGIEPACVLPDTSGIPDFDGVALLVDGATVLIRDHRGNVVVGETADTADFIAAMGIDGQTETAASMTISASDAAHFGQSLSNIRIALPELDINEVRDDVLPTMAAAALARPRPDLLQGAYARSDSRDKLWQPWRLAAMLAGAFVLTALGAKSLEVIRLNTELESLSTELATIASEAMPGARLVDPMLQLEQLAASLRGASGGSETDFLRMLDALASALGKAGNSTLGQLDYRNGIMDLTLTTPDVDTLDRISREIDGMGLAAEIQSANVREEAVEGRIRISGQRS